MTPKEKSRIRLGAFNVILVEGSESILIMTVPTEKSLSQQTLGVYSPLEDKMNYATIRQMYDMTKDGDQFARAMLIQLCRLLHIVHGVTLVDPQLVDEVSNSVQGNYKRIRKSIDNAGKEKPETEQEALNDVAEQEEIIEKANKLNEAYEKNS